MIVGRSAKQFAALIAAAGLLCACGSAAPPSDPSPSTEPKGAEVARPAGPQANVEPALSAEGFGSLAIGMTLDEVIAAYGPDSDPDAVGGPDPESCDQFRPERAPAGMLVMIEEGRLTSISLIPGSQTRTDRGLKVGDGAAAVRSAYGSALRVEPHKYVDAPAEYLTFWEKAAPSPGAQAAAEARGIRFEIDADGRVSTIHAGGGSIEYVEGCA